MERFFIEAGASDSEGSDPQAVLRTALRHDWEFSGGTTPDHRRRFDATRLLDAPEMPVPDPAGLRKEIDELRGRRA